MATASEIPENEMQKMMASVEEIIWSKQTYTVQDIYDRSSFPVLARVEDSFLGDHSTDSYSTGEILWINGGIEQNRVIMESRKGECLSIPISKDFKIRKANREYEKYQPLSETLVESKMGEWNEISDVTLYNRKNDHLWNKLGGYDFKYMKIIGKHSMTFLTAYCLFNEMSILDCPVSVIKHHHQQTFVLGIGLNAQTFIKWTQFCQELESIMNTSINHDDPTLPGISSYSKEHTNREGQNMQLLSTEEYKIRNANATNNSEDQGDKSSCGKTDKHSTNFTSKEPEKEKKKSRAGTLRLLRRQPSDVSSEKATKKSRKLLPQVMKQGKKNKEDKYGKLLLSTDESPRYEKHVSVPENSFYVDLDKPQEQYADNISCCSQSELISSEVYLSNSQSDLSIYNQTNQSKTPISTPKYYERELPMIPPSNVVSTSNSYDAVPSSTSCNEIPASIPECEYDEIDTSTMQRIEKLKINDGPIRQKDDLPEDLAMLTLDQVQDCLNLLHLERLVDTFKENDIDGVILCDLSKDILIDDLGLTKIEALKLRKFVDQKWLPNCS